MIDWRNLCKVYPWLMPLFVEEVSFGIIVLILFILASLVASLEIRLLRYLATYDNKSPLRLNNLMWPNFARAIAFQLTLVVAIWMFTQEGFFITAILVLATFLWRFPNIQTRRSMMTHSVKETIDKSIVVYKFGLSRGKKLASRVYVMSRCGSCSPYLIGELDRASNNGTYKYHGVSIILYTVSSRESSVGLLEKDICYEIFGGLLRKYRLNRYNGQDDLFDTGIKLYIIPRGQVHLDRLGPIDLKIVCSEHKSVMGDTLRKKPIDKVALLLEKESSIWHYSYFEQALSGAFGWKPELTDWETLAKWFMEDPSHGGDWKAYLKQLYYDYITKEMRSAIGKEQQELFNTITNNKEKTAIMRTMPEIDTLINMLDLCINKIIEAGEALSK